jgi:hypothetical protein
VAALLRSLEEVAALKETEGGPIIIHGSSTLNRNLSDASLIDRYHLLVYPLLLGAGKRLFSDTDKDTQKLKLVEHEAYPTARRKASSTSSRDDSPRARNAITRSDRTTGSGTVGRDMLRDSCGVPATSPVADDAAETPAASRFPEPTSMWSPSPSFLPGGTSASRR